MLETSAAYSRQAAEDGEEESKLKKKKTSTQDQKQCVSGTCVIQIHSFCICIPLILAFLLKAQ